MGLQLRLYLLIALMFGILYGVILVISTLIGVGSLTIYVVIAVGFMLLQYLLGPTLVSMIMRVKYVSEKEEPELHRMVTELADNAGIRKPRVGVSEYGWFGKRKLKYSMTRWNQS